MYKRQDEEFPAESIPEPEQPAEDIQPTQAAAWQFETEHAETAEEIPSESEAQEDLTPTAPADELGEAEPEPAAFQPPASQPPAPQRETPEDSLQAARQAVSGGYLDEALTSYGKLIKRGKLLDQIIQDLNDATMRHPINVNLWQTLGDAYLRMDNLQDALDAYSKAEDLIR